MPNLADKIRNKDHFIEINLLNDDAIKKFCENSDKYIKNMPTIEDLISTKNLTFNGGALICAAATTTAFYNLNPTGFTTTAGTGTGTISMTGATAKTFFGGGSTFNCTLNQGGAGTLTITGTNTFNNITNTVQPATVIFPASTITRFLSNFQLSGTSGNLITINSSISGTAATLSLASGTVADNYLSIKDSTATGGATWYAGANSTNVSNVSGWIFANAPVYLIFSGMQISGGVTIF